MSTLKSIGTPKSRVDGRKKVTGNATYSAEYDAENMLHGYIVNCTISTGTIQSIDIQKANEVKGVVEIFTHENVPDIVTKNADYSDPLSPPGKPFRPLYNDKILFSDQPIALVVAETFEIARYAAGLISATYTNEAKSATSVKDNLDHATKEDIPDGAEDRGDAEHAYRSAAIKIDSEYMQPRHYHSPMEPHATLAIWDDEDKSFTIYDKIQGVASSQDYIAGIFNLDKEKVHVLSPFVGGAFGSGLQPQQQLFFAAMASRSLKFPVKVALTRKQMFSFSHRPACFQKVKMGADKHGKLVSIAHQAFGETSRFEKYNETIVDWSGLMYNCENVSMEYQLVPLDVYTPMDMRGPGGTTGMFALECAMDEMAIKAKIDPLQLRLLNYAEKDQNEGKPFSSKELKACYKQAASKFGWNKRKADPRSSKEGHQLIGYGMATGVWEAMQQKASAKAEFNAEGNLTVSTATADIGTGTYTVMSQIAAESFGINFENVDFKLGDTELSKSPIEGGSWTVSSVGSAVKLVCTSLQRKLFDLAKETHAERFENVKFEEVTFDNGSLSFKSEISIPYTEILIAGNKKAIEFEISSEPDEERDNYSCYAHSCVMVEVHVDEDLGMISVERVVTAVAGGKIINPKTAESQILGGITFGIGMALEEEGMMDDRIGRIMNANLAEYHLPIQADIKQIDVIFVEENDEYVNPLGAKGLGEIGLVGVAAAIANAVYNATGKRIRELPITLDKLL